VRSAANRHAFAYEQRTSTDAEAILGESFPRHLVLDSRRRVVFDTTGYGATTLDDIRNALKLVLSQSPSDQSLQPSSHLASTSPRSPQQSGRVSPLSSKFERVRGSAVPSTNPVEAGRQEAEPEPERKPTFSEPCQASRGNYMAFSLTDSIDLLSRTPAVLDSLLRGTAPEWHTLDEGPDTWSPTTVVGHLIHGEETDWIPRARIILEEGPARPFEPFDRFAQFQRFGGWTIDRLLDRFAELRSGNLETVRRWRLAGEQLELSGRHPALGVVTLQQLVATWVVHDLGHLAQVSRVMAGRYRTEVGAWHEYLSILAPRNSNR
jgi:hypothetical protein